MAVCYSFLCLDSQKNFQEINSGGGRWLWPLFIIKETILVHEKGSVKKSTAKKFVPPFTGN